MPKTLRVGYVNVRGLSLDSWKACCHLLGTRFDYLFIAETWFIHHAQYTQDRRSITSTTPGPRNPKGRPTGGIYLLGTTQARNDVRQVAITEYSITFLDGECRVSGVYFPPTTMTLLVMIDLLELLGTTDIMVGDINTRFRGLSCQAGEAGPADRLRAIQDWMSRRCYNHIWPLAGTEISTLESRQLTTDHAFVRSSSPQKPIMRLWKNELLKMNTDHQYTLGLTWVRGGTAANKAPEESIIRFRIGRLSNPVVQEKMTCLLNSRLSHWPLGTDLDQMERQLVEICQRVQRETIGIYQDKNRLVDPGQEVERARLRPETSTRRYKSATVDSRENGVVLPTAEAQAKGLDAVTENLDRLKERWMGRPFQAREDSWQEDQPSLLALWTRDEVKEEVIQQESDKSCGADGIHIRFLKAVKDSAVMTALQTLYNECLTQTKTPGIWNYSEIYLLQKDPNRVRDADNVRPISIVRIFRKVFERLLLLRCQKMAWASLHPGQAGFRRSYSTYTNAAVVHALLSSRARSTAVFLDFKSAFDMVDHGILNQKLKEKGCPTQINGLIQALMFTLVQTRLVVNGYTTGWFPRTCGVLQGSPLSPWLFNLFIDDLLQKMNADIRGIPICLFYADDGVVIPTQETDLKAKMAIVEEWTKQNRVYLNVTKCGIVTAETNLLPLMVYDTLIPQVQEYIYLGFPTTFKGINFPQHIQRRIQSAVARARWLGTKSDEWGPAGRVQVFKQYLAPMVEYGAPLVWAWLEATPQDRSRFTASSAEYGKLMGWISNTSDQRYRVTANLCGLPSLTSRFQHLFTAYQLVLDRTEATNPLKQMIREAKELTGKSHFMMALAQDEEFNRFKETSRFEPTVSRALSMFLRQQRYRSVAQEAQKAALTRLIPMNSRKVPGLYLADISLSASVDIQPLLLQYRRGVFMFNSRCACDPAVRFHRGHENCPSLGLELQLSREEKRRKQVMKDIHRSSNFKFTDIDYLLNTGQIDKASKALLSLQYTLRKIYSDYEKGKEASSNSGPLI